MISKEELTTLFIQESGLDPTDHRRLLWLWWHNPISRTSLRLTSAGFHFMSTTLKVESHTMKIKSKNLGRNLRVFQQLDRYLSTPFFLKRKDTIVFFGSQDLIMLQLHGGDLDRYLENFEQNG